MAEEAREVASTGVKRARIDVIKLRYNASAISKAHMRNVNMFIRFPQL